MAQLTSSSRLRYVAFAAIATAIYTAAQATHLSLRYPGIPWLELYLFELPVWYGLILLSPVLFWLARRFPIIGPNAPRNILLHIPFGIGVASVELLIIRLLRAALVAPFLRAIGLIDNDVRTLYAYKSYGIPITQQIQTDLKYYLVLFLFCYFAIVVFYHTVLNQRELEKAKLHTQELETRLARAQLDSLKRQLQPHFLFNTLNTVSALMTRDVFLARRTLARLGELLREALANTGDYEVSLESEIQFLEAYIEIQMARFDSRLHVAIDAGHEVRDMLIPPMVLQPLVENSIRHGMKDGDEILAVEVIATIQRDKLCITIRDNGRGLNSDSPGEGLGIRNTRERLDHLYPDSSLETRAPIAGGFEVTITMPARKAVTNDNRETRLSVA
jgi:signal transduction histidine kinase